MFKRKYRLPAEAKLNHSSTYKIPSARVMISKNDLSFSRFGFVIGKKIDKRSVVRNRTKRVVRSCLEQMQEQIIKGYDMLFILQKNAVGQKREILYGEIERLLNDARILK